LDFYVNNWIFGNASLKEVAERVSNLGYAGIELVGEPEDYEAEKVKDILDDEGLEVCSICGMFPGPKEEQLRAVCHPEAEERKKAQKYIERCIDLAAGVEARSVLVTPGLVGDPSLFSSRKEDWKRACEVISRAGKYAQNHKIYLTIEPINRYEIALVNSLEDAVKMVREIDNPYVKTMGDTFHMQIEEPDGIPNALRRAGGDQIHHLHAADNTREAPGLGNFDWKEIIRALYDIDFKGNLSLEPLPKGAQPYDAREGNIPAQKLDNALRTAKNHLDMCKKYVLNHLEQI